MPRWRALWAAHDRARPRPAAAWRGREIDKTDGMLLLFDERRRRGRLRAGLPAARSPTCRPAQGARRTARRPGHAARQPRADVARGAKPLEVEGVAKATAARVMSVAHGRADPAVGRRAGTRSATTALRLQSHGHWRLKGIAEPIELFEVGDADAHFRAAARWRQGLPRRAPGRPLAAGARDPAQPAGRARRLRRPPRGPCANWRAARCRRAPRVACSASAAPARRGWLTRFGWSWLGDFPGGVWFCDLAQARSVDGIVNAVAQGLDVPLGSDDPVVQLGHAIAGRGRCLVILDNFEQVARHAERDARALARPAPRGALPRDHPRGARAARRRGAGAARRCAPREAADAVRARAAGREARLPAARADDRRRSSRW